MRKTDRQCNYSQLKLKSNSTWLHKKKKSNIEYIFENGIEKNQKENTELFASERTSHHKSHAFVLFDTIILRSGRIRSHQYNVAQHVSLPCHRTLSLHATNTIHKKITLIDSAKLNLKHIICKTRQSVHKAHAAAATHRNNGQRDGATATAKTTTE